MKLFINPPREVWKDLAERPLEGDPEVESAVREILQQVKTKGDAALKELAAKFDGYNQETFIVDEPELEQASQKVAPSLKDAIDRAVENIGKFHKAQEEKISLVETLPGVKCWRESRPIESVGLYIPSGSAPLFSSLLMLGIPALIAGCQEIVVCTPPARSGDGKINPIIAHCCSVLGLKTVYALGGAHAIAAMAYGTESVPKVRKIFGPGNRFVTEAKKQISNGAAAIDLLAGPSELLVIADESANPDFVAADLLSQAEHGEDSQVILIAASEALLNSVLSALDEQITRLDRQVIARQALERSRAIVFSELSDAVQFANFYAPEHLIIATREPHNVSQYVQNAGSVFLGHYSPESAGDYASGTNHTLPTNGLAAVHSGVSLDSFVKKITFQEITSAGLKTLAPTIETMAEGEGLDAHKEAVTIRMRDV